ncbi:hypothetical protein Tco_0256220 [Tanacetum coccineum]
MLVASVLESIHVYWASVFLLPVGVINDINKILKNFLWNQSDGDGSKTSLWFDNWSNIGTLDQFINHRTMYDARLNVKITVKELMGQSNWSWPDGWTKEFPIWLDMQNISLDVQERDKIMWRKRDRSLCKFSVNQTYIDLINDAADVEILGKMSKKIGVVWSTNSWNDNVVGLAINFNRNSISSIIRRICFDASVYLIWQERNNRIFRTEERSNDELFKVLNEVVRMRLSSLKVKDTRAVRKAQEVWNVKMNICRMRMVMNKEGSQIRREEVRLVLIEGVCLPSWLLVLSSKAVTIRKIKGKMVRKCSYDWYSPSINVNGNCILSDDVCSISYQFIMDVG